MEATIAPLGLAGTSAAHGRIPEAAVADPYAALDSGACVLLRRPQAQCGTIMGSALGILSSVDDLLRYSCALMRALRGAQPFSDLFRSLSIYSIASVLGLFCTKLPGSITHEGVNDMFVRQPPRVVPGDGRAGFVVSQASNLAGYTSFFGMLPDIDASVVVLTNTIALADPASWVAHILIEALVDSPMPVDIMSFVQEAVHGHIHSYRDALQRFGELRVLSRSLPRDLREFMGTYRYTGGLNLVIVVRLLKVGDDISTHRLQVLFQGRLSQTWTLEFLEGDTFHWLCSRDWQAQRGRLTYPSADGLFKIEFIRGASNSVDELIWAPDSQVVRQHPRFAKVPGSEHALNVN